MLNNIKEVENAIPRFMEQLPNINFLVPAYKGYSKSVCIVNGVVVDPIERLESECGTLCGCLYPTKSSIIRHHSP